MASEPLLGLNVPEVPAGLPSEVLRRRPDIAKAESELAAAAANLDAARAALYPSLQLSGSAGLASSALLSLSGATQTLSLGASLAQTLFDGGKLRAQVASSQAARLQLLHGYRKSTLIALGEVEDALKRGGAGAPQTGAPAAAKQPRGRAHAAADAYPPTAGPGGHGHACWPHKKPRQQPR